MISPAALAWWRVPCLRQRVVVNLKNDRDLALRGWLSETRGAWLVLRDVDALHVSTPSTRVDGDVVVHRSNVAFIQVLAHGDHQ